jgi:PASTA domain
VGLESGSALQQALLRPSHLHLPDCHKVLRVSALLAGLLRTVVRCAAVLVVGGALAGCAQTSDRSTAVPNVTGNQLNVAISLLRQDGFPIREVRRVESSAPPNTVLRQNPAASPPAAPAKLNCTSFCSKPPIRLTVAS